MDSEQVDNGLEIALDNIRKAYFSTLRCTLKIDDSWKYVSVNVAKTYYKKLLKVAGRDNIKQVSSINTPKDISIAMFISPEGVLKLREYNETKHVQSTKASRKSTV